MGGGEWGHGGGRGVCKGCVWGADGGEDATTTSLVIRDPRFLRSPYLRLNPLHNFMSNYYTRIFMLIFLVHSLKHTVEKLVQL